MAITLSNVSISSTPADSLSTINGTLIVASDIAGTTVGGALTLGTPSAGIANLLTLANTRGLSAGEGAGISFVDNNTAGTGIERASIHMLVEGAPYNGAIKFSTGLGTSGTYNTGTMTERMRITGSGGISFGSSGTAYGTSGQVLTSNGNAPPTWAAASGGGVIGTTTQVAFNSAGTMSGSGDLTFSGQTLSIGVLTNNQGARLNVTGLISSGDDNGNNGPLAIRPAHFNSVNAGHALTLTGGISARAGGAVNITGGAESTNGYGAGAVNITGGGGFSGTGYAGSVVISGGVGAAQQGAITLNTAGTIRLQVTGTGAWSVGTSGTAYGTSGQVLTSNGNAAPTWQSAGGGTASTLANAVTIGTVVNTATTITSMAATQTGGNPLTIQVGTTSSGQPGTLSILGGASPSGSTAGNVIVRGGTNSLSGAGGTVTIQGGTGGSVTAAGGLTLSGGLGAAGGSSIIFQTGATTIASTRMTIANTGAITFSGRNDTATTIFAASLSINCALVNAYRATLTANTTAFTFTNVPASGQVYAITLFLTQDATGSRTMTWPTGTKWTGGVTPTLTTTATKTDIFTLTTPDGGTTWYGVVVGQNY